MDLRIVPTQSLKSYSESTTNSVVRIRAVMADRITLGLLHAVPAAFSAGKSYIKHKQEKEAARSAEVEAIYDRLRAQRESEWAAKQKYADRLKRADQIFDVLTDLGVMLFRLEVVDRARAKAAWKEVDNVISKKDTSLGLAFEAAKKQKRYGLSHCGSKERTIQLIAGLAFCAACFPMHIYWGYGCGTLNDPNWTAYMDDKGAFDGMDKRIIALKTSGLPGKVLLKQPVGVDKETPRFESRNLEDFTEEHKSLLQMARDSLDRDGFGQPKDPHIGPIREWKVPEAWWSWFMDDALYNNGNRYSLGYLVNQYDPGRLLFAWVNWNRADLAPGEAMYLSQPHVKALAKWLEGLANIKFKLLRDDELYWSHITYPEPLRQRYIKKTGNEYAIKGEICCAVRDPKFYPAGMSVPSKLFSLQEDKAKEEEVDVQFEPVVHLTQPMETKTTEEAEEQALKMRARLFKFDRESKEWKEQGIGDVRLLKHKENGKTRFVMRRDKTFMVCANHYGMAMLPRYDAACTDL